MIYSKSIILLILISLLSMPFEGNTKEISIRFGSESHSPDGRWLAEYQFYKEEGGWYGRISVYSNEKKHQSRAILSVEYFFPEDHFKSRNAVFDWDGANLVVKTEAGIGAKDTRITRININEGTFSMELERNGAEKGSNVEFKHPNL